MQSSEVEQDLTESASHGTAPIFPIFLIVLVDVFGMTLVLPLLAIYAERFHATPFQATLLVSVFAACQLFSGPLLGRMSDRMGRKPMLLISQVGTFIGFIIMARATSLWVLYLARVIDGSTAGNISLAQAYISDNTHAKNRARAFGLIGIAFGVGFFIGPSLTGYLSGAYGLTAPIYLAAGMSAISIFFTATLLRGGAPGHSQPSTESNPGPGGKRLSILDWGSYTKYFQQPILRGLLLEFFCFMLCFSLFTSGFALFAERRFQWHGHPFTPREIGYVFGFVGFLGIILQGGLIGRLVKHFGERKLIEIGFATVVVAYFILGLGWTHTVPRLLFVAAISSFGTGVLRPALTSLITQNASRSEQGVVLGLMQSISSVAAIFAPAFAGFLITHDHLGLWSWSAAALAGAGLMFALSGKRPKQDNSPAPIAGLSGSVSSPAPQPGIKG